MAAAIQAKLFAVEEWGGWNDLLCNVVPALALILAAQHEKYFEKSQTMGSTRGALIAGCLQAGQQSVCLAVEVLFRVSIRRHST